VKRLFHAVLDRLDVLRDRLVTAHPMSVVLTLVSGFLVLCVVWPTAAKAVVFAAVLAGMIVVPLGWAWRTMGPTTGGRR